MNILFAGDSLIEYFDWQKRFPAHSVMNFGIAGESVGGLLSRIDAIQRLSPDADMVVIMSGINNVAMDDLDFIPLYDDLVADFMRLYPEADVFVTSLLPTLLDFIDDGAIRAINKSLEKLAVQRGARYSDIYRLFAAPGGRAKSEYLLADGVHISDLGYEVWSKALADLIKGP